MSLDKHLSYLREVQRESLREGVPSIEEDEGFILYSIAYTYAYMVKDRVYVIDAGAGIGYSTLWLAYGLLDAGCKNCLVEAVEKLSERADRLGRVLSEAGLDSVSYKAIRGDAVDYIRRLNINIDILFIDIEKNRYPEILEESINRVKGLIIYHNALYPPPPKRLYQLIDTYGLKYTIIPSVNGLLVIKMEN